MTGRASMALAVRPPYLPASNPAKMTPHIMTITQRPYRGESDDERMRQLLQDTLALQGLPIYCSVGDLDWWRFQAEDPEAEIAMARLWEADGWLIGIAWPDDDRVDVMTHPHHREIEAEMFAWAEVRYFDKAPDAGECTFHTRCLDSDRHRRAMLTQRGYHRTDDFLHWYYVRSLEREFPHPPLAKGYRIRQLNTAHPKDIQRLTTVHRNAFSPSKMTTEKYERVLNAPTNRPGLNLVVEAPDGSFASYCIVWLDEKNHLGEFEPVGCHERHRRRGLTKALMAEGFRRLKTWGAHTAVVGTGGGNVASNRLYASLGFESIDRNFRWVKPSP